MSVETKFSPDSLRHTPLHALHLALGARMAPFAGYDMPLNYPAGVLAEHRHTRAAAGLFDVSHMGQIVLRPKSGDLPQAALALERLVPADILGLAPSRQRYTFFTNGTGGILDDLMVANRGDHYLLVVNAACKENDESHLRDSLSRDCDIERYDHALVKAASDVYAPLAGEVVETNEAIVNDPSIVNSDPEKAGWFYKLKIADVKSLDGLMDEAAYKELID